MNAYSSYMPRKDTRRNVRLELSYSPRKFMDSMSITFVPPLKQQTEQQSKAASIGTSVNIVNTMLISFASLTMIEFFPCLSTTTSTLANQMPVTGKNTRAMGPPSTRIMISHSAL